MLLALAIGCGSLEIYAVPPAAELPEAAAVVACAPTAEVCDGLDNDCTGAADEPWDLDGDGVAPCAGDCDDTDRFASPLMPDVCDGQDNDCDGAVDEESDQDLDGWASCRGDCDDSDAGTSPDAPEQCDGADNDCDADTSELMDLDLDGYTPCDGDCDDRVAWASPLGVEGCNGVDDDCNGATDEFPECFGCVDQGGWLVCTVAVTWEIAARACADLAGGLAIATTAAENDAIGAAVTPWTASATWIGLDDRAADGLWTWDDGTAAGFGAWAVGQPDGGPAEACAATNSGGTSLWSDHPCATPLPFVCAP